MTESGNPHAVSLRSIDFSFTMNPNGDKKDRYIGIVSNMIELPDKGIFSANKVHATSHVYDNKPRKLGVKHLLVTTDGRDSHMLISGGLAYPPVRYPTNEEMESYPNVTLTPYVE